MATITRVMKSMKRAHRRHKKQVKFEKRLNNWFSHWRNSSRKQENIEKARRGEAWNFLRTTGKCCSCWMCSPAYRRPLKSKTQKEIWDELSEELSDCY